MIVQTLQRLDKYLQNMQFPPTMGEMVAQEYHSDPFVLLIACLLSLRARDTATYPVCKRLFAKAKTPHEILGLNIVELENILRPIGFFRMKARTIRAVSEFLISNYAGTVPSTPDKLLSLPGVGPKTANFMLCLAFNKPAICVDTHVHRLANLFGWVSTTTPEATEKALEQLVPQDWWCRLNSILVRWGQHVCRPRLSQNKRAKHQKLCPCVKLA